MKKIINYRLLKSRYLSEMSEEMNLLIQKGWQPYGAPFHAGDKGEELDRPSIIQAIVQYEENN